MTGLARALRAPAQGAARRVLPEHVALVVAWAGIALLTALSIAAMTGPGGPDPYDQIWPAVRDGRLDLPAAALHLQGPHALGVTGDPAPGLAPLITRALLDPFVTIGAVPLSALSVWLWTVIGTGFWHGALWQAGSGIWHEGHARGRALAGILSAAIWVAGPGVLLASGHGVPHEPAAMAYALAAAFAWLWMRAEAQGRGLTGVLILLGLLAALCLHARPTVAAGLCVATGLGVLRALAQDRRRAILPGLVALGVMGAGLWLHLALTPPSPGERGGVAGFADSAGAAPRDGQTAEGQPARPEPGRFNPQRILPNAVLHYAAPPQVLHSEAHLAVRDWHARVTGPPSGPIRVEPPGAGIAALWSPWALLAVLGLVGGLGGRVRPCLGLVAGFATTSVLVLSDRTVTLLGHVDLFPLILVLAVPGLAVLAPRLASEKDAPGLSILLVMATIVGASVSLRTAHAYQGLVPHSPGLEVANLWSCTENDAGRGPAPLRPGVQST